MAPRDRAFDKSRLIKMPSVSDINDAKRGGFITSEEAHDLGGKSVPKGPYDNRYGKFTRSSSAIASDVHKNMEAK